VTTWEEYRDCAERVAREVLGEPNRQLSKRKELRWGTHGSMALDLEGGRFFDHERNRGGGVRWFLHQQLGLDDPGVDRWLKTRRYITVDDRRPNGKRRTFSEPKQVVVARYDYVGADGELKCQVERVEFKKADGTSVLTAEGKHKKTFRQRRPDPDRPGEWIWNVDGVAPILYRQAEILEAIENGRVVFVVEGEGKADLLWSWNIPATCCAMGSGKWRPEHSAILKGANVVILPDNDDSGRNHEHAVGASLQATAASVRVLDLPGLGTKGDIKDWAKTGRTADELWRLVETNARPWAPRQAGEPKAKPERGGGRDKSPGWRERLIDVRALCDKRFEPVRYVVPELFPEGVTLLASRPKLGKSWLLLQIATAVASGRVTMMASAGQVPIGDVLFLALEDGERRLQRRLTRYYGAQRENWPARFTPATSWCRLDQGGLDDLRAWCASVEKPTLIVIDILKRVRPPKLKNQTDYEADYMATQGLQELTSEIGGLAIIASCHDRKMDAEDVFDTISGTLGMTGGVDTIAVIKRRAGGITLHVEGRDLPDTIEKAINFDRETCRWHVLGEAAEVLQSSERARVLDALRSRSSEALSVAEIKVAADLRSRDSADKLLQRMATDGKIERRGRGMYVLPGTPIPPKPVSEASESPVRRRVRKTSY
jgi:hypothetical protein